MGLHQYRLCESHILIQAMAHSFGSFPARLIRKRLVHIQCVGWIAVLVIACGCGNKPAPTPAPEQKQSGSVDALLNNNSGTPEPPPPPAAPPPPTAPANGAPPQPAEPPPPADAAAKEVARFNLFLFSKVRTSDYVPTDMADLKRIAAAGGLPKIPVAPVGNEIIYIPNTNDPSQSHIELR